MENITDSELAWNEFISERAGSDCSQNDKQRYVRINPDLGDRCPPLDAKQKMDELRETIAEYLSSWKATQVIKQVAHRLVASTFYFQKISITGTEQEGNLACLGNFPEHVQGRKPS